jgi:hypothetical protein
MMLVRPDAMAEFSNRYASSADLVEVVMMLPVALQIPMVIPAVAGHDLGALCFESLASELSRFVVANRHVGEDRVRAESHKMIWALAACLAGTPLISGSALP